MEFQARRPAIVWSCLLFVTLIGVFLRFEAAQGDLWLDEIYSLNLVRPLTSALQVFNISVDNNHYLNSLYLFCLGRSASPFEVRLPAFIFGVLTLGLAVRICLRQGVIEGLLGALVFSFSYILILYGSEARGYSGLLFFAVLCFELSKSYRREPRWIAAVCFWLSAVLGLLSHFAFLHFYAALLIGTWSLWRRGSKPSVGELLRLHLVPAAISCFLVVARLSNLLVAGGPQGSRLEVLINSLTVPYGGGELSISNLDGGVLLLGLAALVLLVLVTEIVQKIRSKQEDGLFFLVLVLGGPLVLLVVFRPQVFVVRYVLLSIFFGYFVFVGFLARLLRRDFPGRVLAGVLLGLFILGNASLLDKLFRYGRGEYVRALEFISSNSSQEAIVIGSDQDFRNSLLVEYFAARAAPGKTFRYVDRQYPHPTEATWVITHSQDQFEAPPADLPDSGLTLAAVFDSAPLSGLRWFVYCKESQCPAVVSVP